MDGSAFAREVGALSLGKRLRDGLYVHVEAVPHLPVALKAAIDAARVLAKLDEGTFNVVKFALRGWKLSLLSYPAFFEDPFPALAASWVVDLEAGSACHRVYTPDGNPPILHRKEKLLPPEHPCVPEFAELTAAAERLGLFDEPRTIGTRRAWEGRLARLGVRLEGHRLVEVRAAANGGPGEQPDEATERADTAPVQRHRTALQRYSLSAPMQALFRHGYLDGRATVFDYGCGRGDDVRILKDLGVEAAGWDPHFAAGSERREADAVNLGFVINVIEDVRERRAALAGAYALARRVLAIAALIGGRTAYEQHRLFRDGVLTTRGTFQKYFTQQELREYLEETLGREPIAVAPGVFFVFRDDAEEQRFLAARQMLARCPARLPKPEVKRRERADRPPKTVRLSRWERHRELLEDFWTRCLELGRLPTETEYGRVTELRTVLGTPPTVLKKLREERGEASLEAARRARTDDLLVYLALNVFERRKSFRRLPESLQRDIAGFWGSYAAAQTEASRLLFSLGTTEVIRAACVQAARSGLGRLDGNHSLQLHASLVPRLPAVLRVYVGCASRLYGEVEAADLVKIHIHSGKLSLMTYDDFVGKPLPRLLERVKISLRAQSVQFFDYGAAEQPQLLYCKSTFLPPEFERYAEQKAFDAALARLGIDLSGFGPPADVLNEILRQRHRIIRGFRLVRVSG